VGGNWADCKGSKERLGAHLCLCLAATESTPLLEVARLARVLSICIHVHGSLLSKLETCADIIVFEIDSCFLKSLARTGLVLEGVKFIGQGTRQGAGGSAKVVPAHSTT
jgi:hypothetical protein